MQVSISGAAGMVTTNKAGDCIGLSGTVLGTGARVLLILLLFNFVAFAAQACVVPSSVAAGIDAPGAPCDEESESCLADAFYNDGNLRSRLTVFPRSGPPTQPLVIPVTPEPTVSSRSEAWWLSDPPTPLRLQICRLLF